jgi:hypothetical protein
MAHGRRSLVAPALWTMVLGHQPLAAAPGTNAIPKPVQLTSAAEDRTARRLAAVVSREFETDPRFRLVTGQSTNATTVSLAARAGWERRLDWTEIRYQARLTSAKGESTVVMAVCWNWNLQACARQIVDSAARFEDLRAVR